MRSPRRVALLVAAALAAGGCTGGRTVSSPISSGASAPLATTVDTKSGVWAVVPMGQLSDPNNTYWQLLYRPYGSDQWVDHVAALGTATNAGISVGAGDDALVAGVQVAQHLTFSPVVETADGGQTWRNGLLPTALARMPQALAIGPSGYVAAIVQGQRLLVAPGSNLATWSEGAGAFRQSPCRAARLNAVRSVGSVILVGATCSRPGVVGVFKLSSGALVGPTLAAGDGPVAVVALAGAPSRVSALLVVRDRWVVASAGSTLNDWAESAPLALDPSAVRSIVAEDDGGFLLLTDSSLAEYRPLTPAWAQLPAPPAGTQTVAREPGGRLSALVVNGTTLVDWELGAGGHWAPTTTLQVPILYGSTT